MFGPSNDQEICTSGFPDHFRFSRKPVFFGFWAITLATDIVQSHNAPRWKAEEQPDPSRGVATLCDLQNRRYRPPKMTRRTLILIPCIFPDLLLRNQKKRSQWRIYCPILMKFFLEHPGTIQVKMHKSKWVVITKKINLILQVSRRFLLYCNLYGSKKFQKKMGSIRAFLRVQNRFLSFIIVTKECLTC